MISIVVFLFMGQCFSGFSAPLIIAALLYRWGCSQMVRAVVIAPMENPFMWVVLGFPQPCLCRWRVSLVMYCVSLLCGFAFQIVFGGVPCDWGYMVMVFFVMVSSWLVFCCVCADPVAPCRDIMRVVFGPGFLGVCMM